MTEKFANGAQTTLNGAIDDNDTTLTLASATAFPASGTFRIIIEDELLLVTGRSGSVLTVERGTEGSAAASHADGSTVTAIVTAAAMSEFVAAIFDDSAPGSHSNIKSNVLDPATIDNTKAGIVSLAHGDGGIPYLGVSGNYTFAAGRYPSVVGDYATGFGYRPNARGMGSVAGGYSSFADGEACTAFGRSCVAGDLGEMAGGPNLTFAEVGATGDTITRSAGSWITDGFVPGCFIWVTGSASNNISDALVTAVTATVLTLDTQDLTPEGPKSGCAVRYELKNAFASGRQNQARALGSFAHGYGCFVHNTADYGIAMGLNCLVGSASALVAKRGIAMGNQSEARGLDSVAIGPACLAGDATGSTGQGAVAMGYAAHASGDTAVAFGNQANATHNGSVAIGTLAVSDATSATAIGKSCQANNDYSTALGYDCVTTGAYSIATGQGARATRYASRVHNTFPSADGAKGGAELNILACTSSNGVAQNMLTAASAELSVDDVKSYLATVTVIASRTDVAADPQCLVTYLVLKATGGTLTIVSQNALAAPVMTTYSAVISAPGGLTLRIAATGAVGHTVDFAAHVEWIEVKGI